MEESKYIIEIGLKEYDKLTPEQRDRERYRLSLENNVTIKRHEPVIARILSYETKGRQAVQWATFIIVGAFISAFILIFGRK